MRRQRNGASLKLILKNYNVYWYNLRRFVAFIWVGNIYLKKIKFHDNNFHVTWLSHCPSTWLGGGHEHIKSSKQVYHEHSETLMRGWGHQGSGWRITRLSLDTWSVLSRSWHGSHCFSGLCPHGPRSFYYLCPTTERLGKHSISYMARQYKHNRKLVGRVISTETVQYACRNFCSGRLCHSSIDSV